MNQSQHPQNKDLSLPEEAGIEFINLYVIEGEVLNSTEEAADEAKGPGNLMSKATNVFITCNSLDPSGSVALNEGKTPTSDFLAIRIESLFVLPPILEVEFLKAAKSSLLPLVEIAIKFSKTVGLKIISMV